MAGYYNTNSQLLALINCMVFIMKVKKEESLKYRLEERIENFSKSVFLRRDVCDLAESTQVNRALKKLIWEEKIARIGYGIYARLRPSLYLDRPILEQGLGEIAREIFNRLNVKWDLTTAQKDYNEGRSTQVPAKIGFRLKVTKEVLMLDNKLLARQIEEVSEELNLERYVIEKDYYVTKLLHTLSDIKNEHYRLVFQGGTCLSKAHGVTRRMSEDSDFRIEELPSGKDLARSAKRRYMKSLRKSVVERIEEAGFDIEHKRVRDEGKFTNLEIKYTSSYDTPKEIRSYMKLDLFLAEVKTPTDRLPITTLIQQTLGDQVKHPSKSLDCISIIETAAEKWIGLTRRIATIKHRAYYKDRTLVRHLYDLYQIQKQQPLDSSFHQVVNQILTIEIDKYGTHNPDYAKDPISEIRRSFSVLSENEWRDNWKSFVEAMVFENDPVGYDQALENLKAISEPCLDYIKLNLSYAPKREHSKNREMDESIDIGRI